MKKPNFFNILVLWTGIFGLLSNSFRGFVKIAFYLFEGMFWRRIVSEQIISILSFSHNEQFFPTFGWYFWGGVVKTAFLVFLTTFWGRKSFLWKNYKFLLSFSDIVREKFGVLVICFRLDCQSSILPVSRRNWEKCCWKD